MFLDCIIQAPLKRYGRFKIESRWFCRARDPYILSMHRSGPILHSDVHARCWVARRARCSQRIRPVMPLILAEQVRALDRWSRLCHLFWVPILEHERHSHDRVAGRSMAAPLYSCNTAVRIGGCHNSCSYYDY